MSQFDVYAQYYDLVYSNKKYSSEANYVLELIKSNSTCDVKNILELGSGTGSHAICVADSNISVHGIDLSPQMIKLANERIGRLGPMQSSLLSFEVSDVRNYISSRKYDAVISLFHVMSYQLTESDLIRSFETTRSALNKGGVFVFDFWYGPGVLADKPINKNLVVENEFILVNRATLSSISVPNNRVDVRFEILVSSKTTSSVDSVEEIHRMRYWFLPELRHHLSLSSFEFIDCYTWMTSNSIADTAWYGCLVARAL